MTTVEALTPLMEARGDNDVVITNQGAAREWPKLASHRLDFHFLPSAMGAAVPLGLGIAIAQPSRQVIVVSGDGSLLMSLGCLATTAGSGASNLTIVLIDNGVYAVTGGQKTPATEAIDYAGLARASGLQSVWSFDDAARWRTEARETLQAAGPRFVHLVVRPERHILAPATLAPMPERIERLKNSLAGD